MNEKELKVREDVNEMVKEIKFKVTNTKYGDRATCNIRLFNDEVLECPDSDGVFPVLKSFAQTGAKDYMKTPRLVEEISKDGTSTYFCALYELTDGTIFRLFPSNRNAKLILNNYYNLFKRLQSQKIQK